MRHIHDGRNALLAAGAFCMFIFEHKESSHT
ncbi:hypothetical protein BASH2_01275 [Bacillus anthracis]|nr:hypothetical protein BASH2_01275 [Bacillus anthracis]